MLEKSRIKSIINNIMEAKERPIVGAAKAAATQKRVTQKVRAAQDDDLAKVSPAAHEKSMQKVMNILQNAHRELSAVFDSEATPHSVKKLDSDHRLTSHLARAIEKLGPKK